eukprot:CAMPEP_0113882758 /NCGR_PEP_ID=MMETSP0780_2-20120614/9161_1 /TAXON_ID=652834 /ORGANISM="Palpitomonas bilix" /LENGTH=222 /DNA_ID=CAMNT_0000869865 /DNA_START=37 /DNA_END=705 /DNA_ORIENTATION=+ /assembly_acc=CAM_ASM_000599
MKCWHSFPLLVALAAGGFFVLEKIINTKTYLSDPATIEEIAKKSLSLEGGEFASPGERRQAIFANITAELQLRYGDHISQNPEWVFINAGGFIGTFCVLHASLTEYILIFGTPLVSSGHSGRYWADIYDTLVQGKYKQWPEGTTEYVVHGPGDTVVHKKWEGAMVYWDEHTWMLEYARGIIPSTLGFALADSLFSTQDFYTVFKTFKVYAQLVVPELLRGQF